MLDVGQGDAVLVEVPDATGGVRMLMDGGPDATAALQGLRRLGVRRLDVVAISHAHHDHTGGLPAVLRELEVGVLLLGPAPLDPASAALSAAETVRVAGQRGVPIRSASAGQQFALGSAQVRVLSPPADGSLGDDLNENSLVLRVATPDGTILLTGDAEILAQERLLRHPETLRADVLKVPHHGGNTSVERFFREVGAHTALIGVGADNDYGHPHPVVEEHLRGTQVLRTDRHGTVGVVLEGRTATVQLHRTPRSRSGCRPRVSPSGGRARSRTAPGRPSGAGRRARRLPAPREPPGSVRDGWRRPHPRGAAPGCRRGSCG
jgi:competence protein ComEC